MDPMPVDESGEPGERARSSRGVFEQRSNQRKQGQNFRIHRSVDFQRVNSIPWDIWPFEIRLLMMMESLKLLVRLTSLFSVPIRLQGLFGSHT